MKGLYLQFISCLLVTVFGCAGEVNKHHIKVSGFIRDSESHNPIHNARIMVGSWYDAGWDKADILTIDTFSDKNGEFRMTFNVGYKIVAAGVAEGYELSFISKEKLIEDTLVLELFLKKRSSRRPVLDIDLKDFIIRKSIE